LDTTVPVHHKSPVLFVVLMIAVTGCVMDVESEDTGTVIPNFVTATLPPTSVPLPTQTPVPPTHIPTVTPVEGTTITQVNVRAEPSTAGDNLGTLAQFSKVQVIGKDTSTSWFQVIYADSPTGVGWVRAEYVQVDDSAEIPVIDSVAGDGSRASGLVIQRMNIRDGPGTRYETLGVLNPNDRVFATGRDASGAWIQIEFADAPGRKGWVSSEFLQLEGIDSLPMIGDTGQTETQPDAAPTQTKTPLPAAQDGDSMESPLAAVLLSPSGARGFQMNGDVSAPDGDTEDWVEFTSARETVTIQVTCTGNALQVEVWNNGQPLDDFSLTCGEKGSLKITPNTSYLLRLFGSNTDELRYTNYVLRVDVVR
jgi:uncharacterized protein YraI